MGKRSCVPKDNRRVNYLFRLERSRKRTHLEGSGERKVELLIDLLVSSVRVKSILDRNVDRTMKMKRRDLGRVS